MPIVSIAITSSTLFKSSSISISASVSGSEGTSGKPGGGKITGGMGSTSGEIGGKISPMSASGGVWMSDGVESNQSGIETVGGTSGLIPIVVD